MKLTKMLLFILTCVVVLAGCSNDIVRERVIEIDSKFDILCAQDPIIGDGSVDKQNNCMQDAEVLAAFKFIIDGIDANKFTLESDLIEFTKTVDHEGSYMFTLHQDWKPNAAWYFVTAYVDGVFQFPEIGTTEMRYVSKDAHPDKFEEIAAFVAQYFVEK